jgi:hypothetical protein
LWSSIPAASRPAGDAISEDIPKDSQRLEGSLTAATCGDRAQWSLTVAQRDQKVAFHQADKFRWGFSDTFWYGQNHIAICHGLEGKRTIVFYKPAAQENLLGDAIEVEVRNDLPPAPKGHAD